MRRLLVGAITNEHNIFEAAHRLSKKPEKNAKLNYSKLIVDFFQKQSIIALSKVTISRDSLFSELHPP